MDCRAFRRNHLAYVDDTLPAVDVVAMQRHLLDCDRCARKDNIVRRSLLLVRNLPPIEPSAGFAERLDLRLRAIGPMAHQRIHAAGWRSSRIAVAAGLVAVIFAAGALALLSGPAQDIALPPVVAMATVEELSPPIATSSFVTSVSTGMAVWDAAMLAQTASMHIASTGFQQVSYTR